MAWLSCLITCSANSICDCIARMSADATVPLMLPSFATERGLFPTCAGRPTAVALNAEIAAGEQALGALDLVNSIQQSPYGPYPFMGDSDPPSGRVSSPESNLMAWRAVWRDAHGLNCRALIYRAMNRRLSHSLEHFPSLPTNVAESHATASARLRGAEIRRTTRRWYGSESR